jgi:acetylornithine deacetylase
MRPSDVTEKSFTLLANMVSIPSLSREEDKVASLMDDHLRLMDPDSLERRGNNVIAIWRGERPGPTLLLCSHLDTVSPASGWTRNPFKATIDGDKLFGLGANDAGASVVSMIGAIRSVGPLTTGTLVLCLAAEEELGSNGFAAIEPMLPRYDAAIFGEPTDMGVASEMRGAMKLVMHSRGAACHASRPWEGRNAIDTFCSDLARVRSIDLTDSSRWGRATIEPTTINGGKSANQIPDLITTTLDIRTTPKKNNDWILNELRALGLELYIESNRRRPMRSPSDHPLVQAIKRARAGYDDYAFNGTCDMAFATAPSVVMGPGRSERSHAADEFCTRGEIHEAIEVYSDTIREYMSRPE